MSAEELEVELKAIIAQVGAAVASPDALREAIRELPVTITNW